MVNIADVNMFTMKKTILWASLLMLISGCQMMDCVPEEQEISENGPVYVAVMEDFSPETKTELDGRRVLWSSGDRITVFDGDDTGKPYLLNSASAGSSSGKFSADNGSAVDGSGDVIDAVVAVYPHSSDLDLSKDQDGIINIENVQFPSQQQYVESSFADASFPMVSMTSVGGKDLQFLNLGGVLRLRVKGSGYVSKITLEGNEGELISGNAAVALKQGVPPVTVMNEDASKSISLVCDPYVKLSEDEAVEFHFSLPPVEFASGFSLTFECAGKRVFVKRTIKSNRVERSSVLLMPEFVLSDMPAESIDLGLSVKWASWNVGAASPEEYGDYFAWGETYGKSSYSKSNYAYYDSKTKTYRDIGSNISGTRYDAASVRWGDGWRMPTLDEIQELADLCTWAEETVGEVDGNKVTGPNGNSIFIPNTGYWQGSSKYFDNDHFEGNFGYFWSATIGSEKNEEAYIMNCELGHGVVAYRYWTRYFGLPVRPVKD